MWVRGLKPCFVQELNPGDSSHPMWVRGLKHNRLIMSKLNVMSHPMWVRGLKLWLIDISL